MKTTFFSLKTWPRPEPQDSISGSAYFTEIFRSDLPKSDEKVRLAKNLKRKMWLTKNVEDV